MNIRHFNDAALLGRTVSTSTELVFTENKDFLQLKISYGEEVPYLYLTSLKRISRSKLNAIRMYQIMSAFKEVFSISLSRKEKRIIRKFLKDNA